MYIFIIIIIIIDIAIWYVLFKKSKKRDFLNILSITAIPVFLTSTILQQTGFLNPIISMYVTVPLLLILSIGVIIKKSKGS